VWKIKDTDIIMYVLLSLQLSECKVWLQQLELSAITHPKYDAQTQEHQRDGDENAVYRMMLFSSATV